MAPRGLTALLTQVLLPNPFCERDDPFVESPVSFLVAADQKDSSSIPIERINDPQWVFTSMPQLP